MADDDVMAMGSVTRVPVDVHALAAALMGHRPTRGHGGPAPAMPPFEGVGSLTLSQPRERARRP